MTQGDIDTSTRKKDAAEEVERSHFVQSFTSSCTIWIRCRGFDEKRKEAPRKSTKLGGVRREYWVRAIKRLEVEGLGASFCLSLSFCSLALALRAGSKLFEEIWCKKNVDHGTEVPSRAVFVIYNYDKKKILKSDHSLMVEIKGTKMLTNKRLKEWAGWTPISDEEHLSSKWKMIRKDQLEVGRNVRGEGLVERSTATKGSCSSE